MTFRALRNITFSTVAALSSFTSAISAEAEKPVTAPTQKVAGTYDTIQTDMDCTPVVTAAATKPTVAKKAVKAAPKKPAATKIVEKRFPTYADYKKYLASLEPKKPAVIVAKKTAPSKVAAKPAIQLNRLSNSAQAGVKYACTPLGGGGSKFGFTPSPDYIPPFTLTGITPAPETTETVPVNDTPVITAGPTCPTQSFCGSTNTPYYPPYGGGGYYPQPPVVIVMPPAFPGVPSLPAMPVTPAIPEPSTYALMAAGIAVVALARRRKIGASKNTSPQV